MNDYIPYYKWLYPGMRVKRWCGMSVCGIIICLLGISLTYRERPVDLFAAPNQFWDVMGRLFHVSFRTAPWGGWAGASISVFGVLLAGFGILRLVHSITSAVDPNYDPSRLVDIVYRNRFLSQGARVVVIGGGTGLSTMLRGLKQYTSNIVAVVTVSDNGGSSGKLMKQVRMLPPGDIRNCLVALADSEAAMTDLFQYRFKGGGGIAGEGLRDHAFGNLLIAAMCDIADGDFEQAVLATSRVLNIRGRVFPSTLKQTQLKGEMEDGSIVDGETQIAMSPLAIRKIMLEPVDALPLAEVLEAIKQADIIVVGPGSVYTSVVPNLLVRGIPEALRASKAKKVYICNVMTQKGETNSFTAADHLCAIESHVPHRVFDYVLVNTGMPSQELIEKYQSVGASLVEADVERVKKMGYRTVTGNFISQTDVVRHDPSALAEAIMKLLV